MDLEFHPQVIFFTAVALSGSIIVNFNNNQAVMLNTVEVYGRTKSIDSHREPYGKLKNEVQVTSLPPPIATNYPDVWPSIINRQDGKKLTIGTQVLNVLVTSSKRLDAKVSASVGGAITGFSLSNVNDSKKCGIFLDMECLKLAKEIVNTPESKFVSEVGIISHQLRQIRTHFDSPSTYTRCRASGPLTKNHTCHPFTLFTLNERDRGRSAYMSIFNTIATEVLKKQENGTLSKKHVKEWIGQTTGKSAQILANILNFYTEDDNDEIPILFNSELNKELECLAELLMPSIVLANNVVRIANTK
ncbi:unnamed protein product [Rhizopus stolonifer]